LTAAGLEVILGTIVVKRTAKSKLFISILNLSLLAVFIVSTLLYASLLNPDQDVQFVLMSTWFYLVPALVVLGMLLLFYGKHFQVPVLNRLIPFIGIVSHIVLPFFDIFPGWNYPAIGLAGTCIGAILGISIIATTTAVLVSKQNNSETGDKN